MPGPVAAHGDEGPAAVVDAPAGPYLITVWTAPDPARPGPIQVAVAVTEAASGRPATDLAVTVEVEQPGVAQPDTVRSRLTGGRPVDEYKYETNLTLDRAGQYRIRVIVAGAGGQGGQAEFDLGIEQATLYTWLVIGLSILTLPATLWLIWEGVITWRKHLPGFGRRAQGRPYQPTSAR